MGTTEEVEVWREWGQRIRRIEAGRGQWRITQRFGLGGGAKFPNVWGPWGKARWGL